MSESDLKRFLALINQQTESQKDLTERLTKVNALAQLTLSENFLDHSKSIIHSYLWALSDTIEQTRNLSEQILDVLLQGTPAHVTVYAAEASSG